MRIIHINRKRSEKEQSIEKLFGFIRKSLLNTHKINIEELENPYGAGFINMLKSMIFFRNNISKSDIVHITGQIHFACLLLKTNKTIITVHDLGLYRDLSPLRKWLFNLFYIYLPFRKAKLITVISQKTKKEILNFIPEIENKIRVIPNCVTTTIEREIFINSHTPKTILIVGTRLNKNIEKGIKALKGINIKLIIVGELNENQNNVLKQSSLVFSNYTFINEELLNDLYLKSDILLFPSLYEGFGLPILEAQAKNTIVVTSNIEPLKEVSGGAAIFVNPKSISSIRVGILKALNLSTKEKEYIITRGKVNLQKYSIEEVASKYYDIYEKI